MRVKTREEYMAAQARNEKFGKRCRDAWYLLFCLSSSAFVMGWWWVGGGMIAVGVGFYIGWQHCTKRALRIMEDHLRSLVPPRPPE